MGDRTFLRITCLEANADALMRELDGPPWNGGKWEPDEDYVDGTVEFDIPEANYGWFEQREAAARKGFLFCGYHYEGGEYSPAVFAAIDGMLYEAEANRDCYPIAQILEDGTADPAQLQDAADYYRALAKVQAIFSGKDPWESEPEP